MFAVQDLARGQLLYRFRDRKRWQEFLSFLKQIRTRSQPDASYVVCDNFAPHNNSEAVDWCAAPMTWSWCSLQATPRG